MSFESGARAALKDAIVARDAAVGRVEGARSAVLRIEDQIFEAKRKLVEAQEAAGEEQAARVQEIVAGGSATLLERVNGRAREADIEREITACRAARDLCKGTLADAETDLGWAERKVVSAIGSLLASSASKLIAEEEELRASLEGKRAILRFLRSTLGDDQRRRVDMTLPPGFVDDRDAAVGPWLSAVAALQKDADAALPE
jgi:hypothetical protein